MVGVPDRRSVDPEGKTGKEREECGMRASLFNSPGHFGFGNRELNFARG
jgi:hypothetical protein